MTTPTETKAITESKLNRLRKQLVKNGFLMEEEGIELLGALSVKASEKITEGCRNLTEAFGYLNEIRVNDLHSFGGYKSFEKFLQEWLDNHRQSRATAWYFMRSITLWTEGLNRPLSELLDVEGGAYAVRPLIEDKEHKIIAEMDARTGEVVSLSHEWSTILSKQYPDAETPTQMVAMWVADNITVEDTGRSIRHALRVHQEVSGNKKDRVKYVPTVQRNTRTGEMDVVGFSWRFYSADGEHDIEGVGFKPMNVKTRRHVLYHTLRLLGINLDTE